MAGKLKYLTPKEVRSEWRKFYRFDRQRPFSKWSDGRCRLYIWKTCPDCGNHKWQIASHVRIAKQSPWCASCAPKRRHDGKTITGSGYIALKISYLSPEDHKLAKPMANCDNYVSEHRLIMARHLNRPLGVNEHVHHRNSKRADNRLANLRLVTPGTHYMAPADDIAQLVTEIEARARFLNNRDIDPKPYLENCYRELDKLKRTLT